MFIFNQCAKYKTFAPVRRKHLDSPMNNHNEHNVCQNLQKHTKKEIYSIFDSGYLSMHFTKIFLLVRFVKTSTPGRHNFYTHRSMKYGFF